MSRETVIRYANLPGTAAGVGRIGTRVLIADRPEGVAGGLGLGFNGAELFAAALGGCFWNDLHYAADRLGSSLDHAEVEVHVTLAGHPVRVVRAKVWARLTGSQARTIFDAAAADSTIANSVMAAIPVTFELQGANP